MDEPARIIAAAFSPIVIASAFVLPLIKAGMMDASASTNPICFGFPSTEEPVNWDVGTSAIIHAEVVLAKQLGQQLPDGMAFAAAGRTSQIII